MKTLGSGKRTILPYVKRLLLENEKLTHSGKNMLKVQEMVCRLVAGLNGAQWRACTPVWRKKVLVTANAAIGAAYVSMKRLDIGCGVRKRPGFIGIDIEKFNGVDVVLDLTKAKLPYKDSTIDAIYSDHFLEHLAIEDIGKLMEEIHRVCTHEALVEIHVPHFSGFTNFYEYHKTSFRLNSFAEFLWEEGMFTAEAKYELISRKISLVNRQSPKNHAVTKWFFWNHPMEWLVNKMPRVYEMSGWRNIFPAWELIFKFKVVK